MLGEVGRQALFDRGHNRNHGLLGAVISPSIDERGQMAFCAHLRSEAFHEERLPVTPACIEVDDVSAGYRSGPAFRMAPDEEVIEKLPVSLSIQKVTLPDSIQIYGHGPPGD
ncbi:hypothetical protein GCM10007859_05790 [Brevundimonas denitrificans]|uniref:Uncharacterized protein n=1 Tax=Brevundimonas denitrificans TaxID=1443434 RepID=A0ABQ6BHC0_9CAUL|nr:hypothetical protein GCM10007859_05790 [Brevundimonas denitrificans]